MQIHSIGSSTLDISSQNAAECLAEDQYSVSTVNSSCRKKATDRKVKVLYRFEPKKEIQPLLEAGGLAFNNVQEFIDNDANFLGDGIYLAESLVTAQRYGDSVVEVWVDEKLIEQGNLKKFGGLGRDWWLGQIEDSLEAAGFDLKKIAEGAYKSRKVAAKLRNVGIYYKEFKGTQFLREEMELIISCSKEYKKEMFQKILDVRLYQWSVDSEGKLHGKEYTDTGLLIGDLNEQYCTFEFMKKVKSYKRAIENGLKSETNNGFKPSGFKNDIKALSKKNILGFNS